MDFHVASDELRKHRTGCIVAGVYEGRKLSPTAAELDALADHAIERVIGRGDLEGALGATLLLRDLPNVAAERVLLVGLGSELDFVEASYRKSLSAALGVLRTTGATQATICLHELPVNRRGAEWRIEQAVLTSTESFYRFDRLKSTSSAPQLALKKLVFHFAERDGVDVASAAIARAVATSEGIVLAKDLGNLPGNLCTPTYLADQARDLGERHGLDVAVLDQKAMEELGMGALLAVARGSCEPPKLVVLEYHGDARDGPPIVLVGKGITFDAGGISIKPALEMDEMKFDMCGAASVLGAMHASALLKLPLNLVAILPVAENMPGGNATKPGDVVTTMSGQTVEILDTDSEGRLILCDALTYAERYKPAALIDVATLTGEIVSALGEVASGLFSNDDALAGEVLDAGERAWDRAWRMPLWDDYQDALKSNFADFANVGSGSDCAATAACFLSRFTKRYPWAHLDIAGTASKGGAEKGATGRPVALLVQLLAARAQRAAATAST
ncbi:MAG: leucyl aminopeptidase [Rhizobacter sp.]|nr:leucyl aminopeptidase [Rhizobacter sp.]